MAESEPSFDGKNSRNGLRVLWKLAWLGGFAWLIWAVFVPDSWRDNFNYSNDFHLNSEHIHSLHKPTDCNWGHAPLGDKACHYEKHVELLTSSGESMSEEEFKKATVGKGLYDPPAPVLTDVRIYWVKIQDN